MTCTIVSLKKTSSHPVDGFLLTVFGSFHTKELFNEMTQFFFFTVPTERSTILKENFNRWYSVKSYYISITLIDLPISVVSSFLFSFIIYVMVGWPLELQRFTVFYVVSLLVVLVSQTVGLIIGSCFGVIVSISLRHFFFELNQRGNSFESL